MTTKGPFSVDDLLARARKEAGLQDFGTAVFMPAMQKFVHGANGIADNLRDDGKKAFEDWVIRLLVNRLRMHRDIQQNPGILQQKILPPSAIIGLPRTGSTKLQHMLAAGHGFLEPLFWQLFNPAPFPTPPNAKPGDRDLRIQSAIEFVSRIAADAPDAHKGHQRIVEQADEECYYLDQTFETPSMISFFPAYDWCKYIERLDKTEMYQHLRVGLQYLQWQFHPNANMPWLLKYPANLGNESYISRTFPGIKYVVTHRDPFPVIASLSQMISATHLLNCKTRDIKRFSVWAFEEFASEMDRHLAWRDANPDVVVLDVSFKDIVGDGMGTARRIYDFFGAEWSAETEGKIREWIVEDEKVKDRLEYSFDDIAYTKADFEERWANYYQRFGHMF